MHKNQFRQQAGQQAVELVAGLFVIISIVLACMDIGTLFTGAALNESLARDAARAASTGPPGQMVAGVDRAVDAKQPPYQRASAAIEKAKPNTSSFALADMIHVTETVEKPLPTLPYGGPVTGTVTVQTTMLVRPRFLLPIVHSEAIALNASATFPYTWVMKSSLVPITDRESAGSSYSESSNYATGSYSKGSYSSGSYASKGSYSSGSYAGGK